MKMRWIPDDVVMLKKMETMNNHDLYDYIFNHSDAFVFVCKSSIDLLHLKRSLKGVEEESFEKEESFNKRLDSVMGELLIQEMDAYNVQNMQIADFLDTAENMTEEEYNYLNMLTYYMERLKCYPKFYVFEYRTQEVKKAYFDAIDLIIKYREMHFNRKVIESDYKPEVQTIDGEEPTFECGYVLAKNSGNLPQKWFTRQQVLNGEADDYITFKYMLNGKLKGWNNLSYTKSQLSNHEKKLNIGKNRMSLAPSPDQPF